MEDIKVISGSTEQEVWAQLEADLFADEVFYYKCAIKLGGKEVWFILDIDLGGGFESGSEFMQFKAPLYNGNLFKFALHDQDFVDVVGKFLGMEDVEIGYEELDHHLIIKTNDKEKLRHLFANAGIREVFAQLGSFDCGLHTHHAEGNETKQPFLEMNINKAIYDPSEFRKVFDAFYSLLSDIETAQ